MSFIYGAKGSYIKDRKSSQRNKSSNNFFDLSSQSNEAHFSLKNLLTKFQSIFCQIDRDHGHYDFICVSKDYPHDRLVCIDCLKDSPEKMRFMQSNGKSFLRMNKFLDVINKPNLGARDFEKIESVKKMEGKLNRLLANYEKSIDSELDKLKDFYKKMEDGIIEAVRRAMKRNYENSVEEFESDIDKNRSRLSNIYSSCRNLTKLLNKGHITDLSHLISSPQNDRKIDHIQDKINDIVDVLLNLDHMIDEWTRRMDSLGSYPERMLKPKIDLLKLGGIFKQKELVVMEELENLYDLRDRNLSRGYSKPSTRRGRETSPVRFEDSLQDMFGLSKRSLDRAGGLGTDRLDFSKNLDISKIPVWRLF